MKIIRNAAWVYYLSDAQFQSLTEKKEIYDLEDYLMGKWLIFCGKYEYAENLCKLAIAESTDKIPFGKFISSLLDAGATEALYTDMGNGWNYSWYREYADKRATLIHPGYQEKATNWLVFLFL